MFWERFKEKFKSRAQRQEEEEQKQIERCELAVRVGSCPRCCVICSWNVNGKGSPNLKNP